MEWKQKSSSAGKPKKVEPEQHPCPRLWAVGTHGSCTFRAGASKFVFPSGSDSFPFAVDLLIVLSGNGCHSGLMLSFFCYHHLPATNSLWAFQLLVINKYIWTEPTLLGVSAVRSKNHFLLLLAIRFIWIKISILLLFFILIRFCLWRANYYMFACSHRKWWIFFSSGYIVYCKTGTTQTEGGGFRQVYSGTFIVTESKGLF